MDSDDEMSGLSSQDDFNEDLDSDDGSLGEGMIELVLKLLTFG